jgi:hypothetical protein
MSELDRWDSFYVIVGSAAGAATTSGRNDDVPGAVRCGGLTLSGVRRC